MNTGMFPLFSQQIDLMVLESIEMEKSKEWIPIIPPIDSHWRKLQKVLLIQGNFDLPKRLSDPTFGIKMKKKKSTGIATRGPN